MTSDERFLVSGWDEDLDDIDEEKNHMVSNFGDELILYNHTITCTETPEKEVLWAAEKGKLNVIKQLIESNPSLIDVRDSDGYTPLHRACYGNHTEVVKYLLQHNANVSTKTQLLWQPLHSACQWNNKECVVLLLQNGADINAVTEGGQTPLHIAASHGTFYDTVQILLMDPYIKPDILNKNNETAYDIAKRSSKFYKIFEMANPAFKGIKD